MSYYEEKARAIRIADTIINEVIYVNESNIDLIKLNLEKSASFKCNFMKVFKERLKLFQEQDSRIQVYGNIVSLAKSDGDKIVKPVYG